MTINRDLSGRFRLSYDLLILNLDILFLKGNITNSLFLNLSQMHSLIPITIVYCHRRLKSVLADRFNHFNHYHQPRSVVVIAAYSTPLQTSRSH